MNSVSDIIHELGGTVAAAATLNRPQTTVSSWKSRDSIPASEWHRIVEASHGRITYEDLGRVKAASMASRQDEDAA